MEVLAGVDEGGLRTGLALFGGYAIDARYVKVVEWCLGGRESPVRVGC